MATAGPLLLAVAIAGAGAPAADAAGWVATWAAPLVNPLHPLPGGRPVPALRDRTVRLAVGASIGGEAVRLRFSNAFGSRPVVLGKVRLALHAAGAAIVPGSDRAVTFGGEGSVRLPPGGAALSDPVVLPVAPQAVLAASFYLPDETWAPARLAGPGAVRASFVSPPGDFASVRAMPVASRDGAVLLAGLEVKTARPAAAVVVIGDSIAAGVGTSRASERAWPFLLARRLAGAPGQPAAVLEMGISGNRLLHHGFGDSALARFDRDVLGLAGATHVVAAVGLNDLHLWRALGPPVAPAADEIVAGLRQLIARTHRGGLRIIGATITPFQGYRSGPLGSWTQEMEQARQAVNRWIRTGGEFDGVADFDAAIRDPANAARMLPVHDCGDHLHPGDSGHRAMVEAIDLSLLRPRGDVPGRPRPR